MTVELVDTWTVRVGVAAEGNVEGLQELVAAGEEGLGLVGAGLETRLTVEDDDAVGEVGRHDEIVLDDEGGLLAVHDEALDHARSDDTLLGIEVGGWLVDKVDVGWDSKAEYCQYLRPIRVIMAQVRLTQARWLLSEVHHQTGSGLPGR